MILVHMCVILLSVRLLPVDMTPVAPEKARLELPGPTCLGEQFIPKLVLSPSLEFPLSSGMYILLAYLGQIADLHMIQLFCPRQCVMACAVLIR